MSNVCQFPLKKKQKQKKKQYDPPLRVAENLHDPSLTKGLKTNDPPPRELNQPTDHKRNKT